MNNAADRAPQHVAIIMDGNGRWAKSRGIPRSQGHVAGVKAIQKVVDACLAQRIPYLSLFGFSSENWSRSNAEIATLMQLFMRAIATEAPAIIEAGVKLQFIGERAQFSDSMQQMMLRTEQDSAHCTQLKLILALNYGGRDELVHVCRSLAQQVEGGALRPDEITAQHMAQNLYSPSDPEPDVLIRTSGERRLSNYMLWQLAYSELVFSDVLWPDFGQPEFEKALAEYQLRNRRFGAES